MEGKLSCESSWEKYHYVSATKVHKFCWKKKGGWQGLRKGRGAWEHRYSYGGGS